MVIQRDIAIVFYRVVKALNFYVYAQSLWTVWYVYGVVTGAFKYIEQYKCVDGDSHLSA